MGIGKTVNEIGFSMIHFVGVKSKLHGRSVEKSIGIWACHPNFFFEVFDMYNNKNMG